LLAIRETKNGPGDYTPALVPRAGETVSDLDAPAVPGTMTADATGDHPAMDGSGLSRELTDQMVEGDWSEKLAYGSVSIWQSGLGQRAKTEFFLPFRV